jgi:hypothetical protein
MPSQIAWPRVAVAGLLAAGAATGAFVSTERHGDPQRVVDDVARQINDLRPILHRHTFHLRGADAAAPADESRTLYRVSGPKGELLFLEGPAGRSAGDIEQLASSLLSTPQQTQYVSTDSAWTEIRQLASGMIAANQRIAAAKALRALDSKPAAASSEDWASRFPDSNIAWRVQEAAEFQWKRAFYAAMAGLATFAIVMLALGAFGLLRPP